MQDIHFLIWSTEHNAYWRPDSAGYTRIQSEAGRYSEQEAQAICDSNSRRSGSTLDECVPAEIMMVAPEEVSVIRHARSAE